MIRFRPMNISIGNGKLFLVILTFTLLASASEVIAWDHPGHMTTAAIAFAEIERLRPELIEKIGMVLIAHPDPSPYWVAAGDTKGKERARRMFIEAARWADDAKGTIHDRPTWHTARWPIIAKDSPPEAKAAAEARKGKPAGQAIEALVMNYAMLSSSETNPTERASALAWLLHMIGDIHQPLHVSDQYSKEFPAGNAAGTLQWVEDPMNKSPMPLHMLWDSNSLRLTELEEIDKNVIKLVKKYPRSSFPELATKDTPDDFEKWARESYNVAVDFAYGYGIETVTDPDKDLDSDKAVKKMVQFVLFGVSPVEEAPEVPAVYWKKLQDVSHRRLTLAGYRIADLIISAGDQIIAERTLAGKALETLD
jgi:S1/P1 Nuclease